MARRGTASSPRSDRAPSLFGLLVKRSWALVLTVALLCSAGCGHRAYRVVTRPPSTDTQVDTRVDKTRLDIASSQVRATDPVDTRADPIGRLRAVRAAYTALTTTTTSAPPTTAARLVVPPGPQAGPTPISAHRCTGAVEAEIEAVFGQAAPWAASVAWRESRCTPTARNPSGSSGLFQLLLPLHDDLLQAVGCQPSQWMVVACAVRAAYLLYEGSGTRPWR